MLRSQQVGNGEHVGIFQWFVFALGDRKHHDLVRFPKIEARRADEVADILDEQEAAGLSPDVVERGANHAGFEVATLAGVDLNRASAGGPDALGVIVGLLGRPR